MSVMFGINAGLFFILSYFLEIVLFTSLAAAQTGAQPGKFGRMPDGRAYRIDAEGYRIVDRLAELEVTADDLERQVDALENQLADKEKALTRLREGRGEDPAKVIESSLIGVEQDVRGVAPGKTKATEVPNCNELVSNLYRRVAQLERHENNAPSAHVRCDYNSSENPW
ncbi:MAG TPA: hypothetical protein PLP17_11370, partial [Oligoflexia bacterium]|nr:hypothetical protein [Oligoflexia bacterium]